MDLKYAVPTDRKTTPLQPWQRNANQSGYGNKIRTDHMVQLGTSQWYRVYAICHSNVASLYVLCRGEQMFIRNL